MALSSFCIILYFLTVLIKTYHFLPDVDETSDNKMKDLTAEINRWKYKKGACELTALNGIIRLRQSNLSYSIKQGLSLIYFIRKSSCSQNSMFGSSKIEWLFHCCIGFVDIYLGRDWFIDLSYHICMIKDVHFRTKRLIEKEKYLQSIPDTVDAFVIPLMKLEYFINAFRVRLPQTNLGEFANSCQRSSFMPVFDSRIASQNSSDFEVVHFMMSKCIIFKCESLQSFYLPIARFESHWV